MSSKAVAIKIDTINQAMRIFTRFSAVMALNIVVVDHASANSPGPAKTADAMLSEIATWQSATNDQITVYSPPDDNSKIIVARGDPELTSPANIKMLNLILPVAEQYCPGLSAVKPRIVQNISSQILTINGNICTLLSGRGKDGQRVFILSLEKAALQQNRVSYAAALYAQTIHGTTVGTVAVKPVYADTQPSTSKTSLKTVMDSIPANRRPIAVVYSEGEWDSYNASITFVPHLLFPGGIMIDAGCTTWNPDKPVTAATAMGCPSDNYTLKGRTAFYKGDSESIDDYQGFKKNDRIAVNFSRVGGLPNTGLPNVGSNAVWGGELTMTASGQIRVGSWSGATVSDTGFTAYGGGAARGIQGQYYLDGYLIAVQDDQGKISVSFIWQQDGQHIFLNGKQYNR